MDKMHDLKLQLYELIEEVAAGETGNNTNDADITMQQNMGISLTKAIKKDGVNIIQIQSTHINKVIPKIINCLKIIDDIDHKNEMIEYKPVKLIEADTLQNNDLPSHLLFEFYEYSYSNNYDCKKITDIAKVGYAQHLQKFLHKFNDVLDFMDISQSVIYNARKRIGIT